MSMWTMPRMIASGIIAVAMIQTVRAQDVRVTVVAIMATDKNDHVDPKLKDVAKEVRKQEHSLTGFRIGPTISKEINVGQKEAISLFEEKGFAADVKLLAKDDTKKRATLEVKPPLVGAITYSTTYNKFFPIVTRAIVDGERLIIAIMVKPAGDKVAKP